MAAGATARAQVAPLHIVEIFLASSEELRADRDSFDHYCRQLNDLYSPRGVYLKIVRWENFLDAISERRLQDDYNARVQSADLFVSLFASKVGKYTEEEFDVALRAFRETGKPRIFTFFKDTQVPASATSLPGLKTLVEFQGKLTELGHFHTRYEGVEHLKRLFRDQLDHLGIGGP
jgi:hypothetical protein